MADQNPSFSGDRAVTNKRKQSKSLHCNLERTIRMSCVNVCAGLRTLNHVCI
jgi:hypothetical protein